MAEFKPDVAVTAVDVGVSHRRRSEQHGGSDAAGGSGSGTGSSHKTNLLGRLASFFGRSRTSGGGGRSSGTSSSSSKKQQRASTPSRSKTVVVLKAKSMNDLAFPAIENWQQDPADPPSAEQQHSDDREQQSTLPGLNSASSDSLFGLREAAATAASSVEDVPDGSGWGRLAPGTRALSQSADTLSAPEAGAVVASASSSLPSSDANEKSLALGLGTSSRQFQRTDGRQLKQRPVSAVFAGVSEDDGLPWSSVDSVSSTPPTSAADSAGNRRAASRGTSVGLIATPMPASMRFMSASDSMLSSAHRNSDSGILSDRSTDTEEEFFRDPWRAAQHAGSRRQLSSDSDSDVDVIDLDIITKTEALTNPGARHKQLLRPKKSKSSVPAMPKVEEKNVLELASCFGSDGSRRQPPTATIPFGDADVVGARLSNSPAVAGAAAAASGTAAAAAETAAAPTAGHRRLSATSSVPPLLLSRELSDAVRSRRRSSSDAAEQRGASCTAIDSAATVVMTTNAVASVPSSGSTTDTSAVPAAEANRLDVSRSLHHDDRQSEVVDHAAATRNREAKQAAPAGGSALPSEPAVERPIVVNSPSSSASASIRPPVLSGPLEAYVARDVRDATMAAAHDAAVAVGSPSVTVSSPAAGDQAMPPANGSESAREGEAAISPVAAAVQLRHTDDQIKSRTVFSKQSTSRTVDDRPWSSVRDLSSTASAAAAASAAGLSSIAAVSVAAVELRKNTDSDVRQPATGRPPSVSIALLSNTASSPVLDVAGAGTSATAAAAAVTSSVADAQASELVTGAAALARYKSMFKQKPSMASGTAPADAAATHSPGDRDAVEATTSPDLASTKPPLVRRLRPTAAASRLPTSHQTTDTESDSSAASMAPSLPASLVPVAVVSANLTSGLAPPEKPTTSSATTAPMAPGIASSGTQDASKGVDKPSGILRPTGAVSKPVKPLPNASATTTKLPLKTPQTRPSSSGPPAEGQAAATLPHLPPSAADAAIVAERATPTFSPVSRADQSREHVGLRHPVSSHKPQESSLVSKVAATAAGTLPAEPTSSGALPAHALAPTVAPAAAAAAAAVAVADGGEGDASYKRKSVRELVSRSSPTPATVDAAAAARPSLSHGPSVRRQQLPPQPHPSSTQQHPAVASKIHSGDRAAEPSAAGDALAAARQPTGAAPSAAGTPSVPAAASPQYPGATSNGGTVTASGRKSTAMLSVTEPSATSKDTAAHGSTPGATLSQTRQSGIGRPLPSRTHNADQGLLPAERSVVTTTTVIPSSTVVDSLPAATVVNAPSTAVSSHHRAATVAAASSTANAAAAGSKLSHSSSLSKPSRGLTGSSSSSWTQERSRSDRDDVPPSGSTSSASLPDAIPQEPRSVAGGSAAATLPDAAEGDSSAAAVSAEKAASVKDRMKLFQRP